MRNVVHRLNILSDALLGRLGSGETPETERDSSARRPHLRHPPVRHHARQDREFPQSGALRRHRLRTVAQALISDILIAQYVRILPCLSAGGFVPEGEYQFPGILLGRIRIAGHHHEHHPQADHSKSTAALKDSRRIFAMV